MNIPKIRIPFSDSDISFVQSRIKDALSSGQLSIGKNVKEFEDKFAEFVGTKYAIATNSGTSALEIILRSINVRRNSVIIPTNTMIATPFAAIHAGAKVIFSDIRREDLSMDVNDLIEKIDDKTKVVILVHIGGIISSQLKEIQEVCDDYDVLLIEDAAHAHGSMFDNEYAGSLGIAGAFSFYPTKVMTCGEGGMITTNNEQIYKKAIKLRDQGRVASFISTHTELGYNWRMSELNAIVGLSQMSNIDWILYTRQQIANIYDDELQNVNGIKCVEIPSNILSSYYKYIVYINRYIDTESIINKMRSQYQIELPGQVYAEPCHSQPVFKKYPEYIINMLDKFPEADYVCQKHICLPLYPDMTMEEVVYIVKSLGCVINER